MFFQRHSSRETPNSREPSGTGNRANSLAVVSLLNHRGVLQNREAGATCPHATHVRKQECSELLNHRHRFRVQAICTLPHKRVYTFPKAR
jgi:hypothetical protein